MTREAPEGMRIEIDHGTWTETLLPDRVSFNGTDEDGQAVWLAVFEFPSLFEALVAGAARFRLDRLPPQTTVSLQFESIA